MPERFTKDAREIAAAAGEQARVLGSPVVEAEHLLLALADGAEGPARTVLEAHGLGHAELLDALELAFERALELAGVSTAALRFPPTVPLAGRPRWGASAKAALEHAFVQARSRGDRRIEPGHILLALLAVREGTVPRALRAAGVEPAVLAAATSDALRAP